MNKLNQWLSISANVGVLIGVVFLVIEIQQNTDMLQSQTRDSITDKQVELYQWFHDSALTIALASSESLQESVALENELFFFNASSVFRIWENEYYQFQQGLFEPDEFEPRVSLWKDRLNNQGYRNAWNANERQFYAIDFVELIDSLIEAP